MHDHHPECRARKAFECAVGVECEHGFDVCHECDPCTCHEHQKPWEIWGDAGKDQLPAIQPTRLRLEKGEVLVVVIPRRSTQLRVKHIRDSIAEVKKRAGWEGEILLVHDDIELKVAQQDEAERLLEATARAAQQFANAAGTSVAAATEALQSVGRAFRAAAVPIGELSEAIAEITDEFEALEPKRAADDCDERIYDIEAEAIRAIIGPNEATRGTGQDKPGMSKGRQSPGCRDPTTG